ncbi:MAG TPA: TrmH family RNA methyltransferase [Bacteroidota bacterium]|nr:TrmH family RNA methyltransferase [Bacteroidota bacterium]
MRKLEHHEIAGKRFTASDLAKMERFPIYALLDDIRSLYNVGSIFRTADGARVARLILAGYTPSPPRKEIDKTALGATATVPWEYVSDPLEAIASLKRDGVKICLVEHTDISRPYDSLRAGDFPVCLVVGNEITGIRKEIVGAADMAIDIPMYGMKQSLNAAVAFGIAVFACARIAAGGGS